MSRPESDADEHPTDAAEEHPTDLTEELVARCLEAPVHEREALRARLRGEHPEQAEELDRRLDALGAALAELTGVDALPERLGDFRLLRRIGVGGMGVVFEAEQESIGRRVAVKLVRPELSFFEASRARFRREVEAAARLCGPGIVPVHAVGEEHGLPFFAMELVDGCTLAEVLEALRGRDPRRLEGADLFGVVDAATRRQARDRAVPVAWRGSWVDACVDVVRQVARTLAHAHAEGVVHRDVKPSNISVEHDGRARLLDFGLASLADAAEQTRTGAQLGTLHYMSPEQLRGERELDGRADVYSLGATLYQLLALQPPFEGGSAHAVQALIEAGRPAPLRDRNRRVSRDLETVVATAMEADRGRRYAGAAELADDLEALLEGRSIAARPPGPVRRLRRWARARPVLATLLVAGFLLFVVAPSVFLLREVQLSGRLADALEDERLARERAERAQVFVTDLFRRSDPTVSTDPDLSARELLDGAAERVLDGLDEDPELKARLSWNLGDAYRNGSRPREAQPLLETALELGREVWGERSLEVAAVMDALASARLALGDVERAESLFREALAIQQERAPERVLALAGATNNLALVLLSVGRLSEAEELLREAVELYEAAGPEGTEWRADALVNLASMLMDAGRASEATELAEQALAAQRTFREGPHPALIGALNVVGRTQRAAGDFEAAERSYLEAIELQSRLPAANDPTLPTLYYNLVLLRRAAGRVDDQADAWLRLAAEGMERAVGPDAPFSRRLRSELEAATSEER